LARRPSIWRVAFGTFFDPTMIETGARRLAGQAQEAGSGRGERVRIGGRRQCMGVRESNGRVCRGAVHSIFSPGAAAGRPGAL